MDASEGEIACRSVPANCGTHCYRILGMLKLNGFGEHLSKLMKDVSELRTAGRPHETGTSKTWREEG